MALKILRRSNTNDQADFFSSVLSEVMLMQSVLHPNLVRIYGVIPLNPLVIVSYLSLVWSEQFVSVSLSMPMHSFAELRRIIVINFR